ncbi:hypothetical protein Pan216_39540 [Planctomycetes bacterium Pan216]|uniref:Carboxypeptidase regulatory-like domain-containing protein n=1 Tax=Kolteria novifilia TaxID=2527975 RepID=A0A518B7X3_9BACT|nr:hypothetical protein Pan216_39540 [Planctomycetes bacterium Pan216]
MNRQFVRTAVALCGLGLLSACSSEPEGPKLGDVAGIVTLDGRPLHNAWVIFTPESGLSSYGQTDMEGRYELQFTARRSGAVVGDHQVQIGTKTTASEGQGVDRPETVPATYNEQSNLVETVSMGQNTIDFELTSSK